jgi:RNA polymerase sigma factor (sigma-70 family)
MKRTSPSDNSDVWDDLARQPESSMDGGQVQKRRALEFCLSKLEPSLRAQVLLRYQLGLSHAEIGEITGEAHGTVQVRLSRAMPKLKECLKRKGGRQ